MSDEEYQRRLADLQRYLPFLENTIKRLKSDEGKLRETQISKLQSLHDFLKNTKGKKLKLDVLRKCEEVILKLREKKPSSDLMYKYMCRDPPDDKYIVGNRLNLGLKSDDVFSADQQKLSTKSPSENSLLTKPAVIPSEEIQNDRHFSVTDHNEFHDPSSSDNKNFSVNQTLNYPCNNFTSHFPKDIHNPDFSSHNSNTNEINPRQEPKDCIFDIYSNKESKLTQDTFEVDFSLKLEDPKPVPPPNFEVDFSLKLESPKPAPPQKIVDFSIKLEDPKPVSPPKIDDFSIKLEDPKPVPTPKIKIKQNLIDRAYLEKRKKMQLLKSSKLNKPPLSESDLQELFSSMSGNSALLVNKNMDEPVELKAKICTKLEDQHKVSTPLPVVTLKPKQTSKVVERVIKEQDNLFGILLSTIDEQIMRKKDQKKNEKKEVKTNKDVNKDNNRDKNKKYIEIKHKKDETIVNDRDLKYRSKHSKHNTKHKEYDKDSKNKKHELKKEVTSRNKESVIKGKELKQENKSKNKDDIKNEARKSEDIKFTSNDPNNKVEKSTTIKMVDKSRRSSTKEEKQKTDKTINKTTVLPSQLSKIDDKKSEQIPFQNNLNSQSDLFRPNRDQCRSNQIPFTNKKDENLTHPDQLHSNEDFTPNQDYFPHNDNFRSSPDQFRRYSDDFRDNLKFVNQDVPFRSKSVGPQSLPQDLNSIDLYKNEDKYKRDDLFCQKSFKDRGSYYSNTYPKTSHENKREYTKEERRHSLDRFSNKDKYRDRGRCRLEDRFCREDRRFPINIKNYVRRSRTEEKRALKHENDGNHRKRRSKEKKDEKPNIEPKEEIFSSLDTIVAKPAVGQEYSTQNIRIPIICKSEIEEEKIDEFGERICTENEVEAFKKVVVKEKEVMATPSTSKEITEISKTETEEKINMFNIFMKTIFGSGDSSLLREYLDKCGKSVPQTKMKKVRRIIDSDSESEKEIAREMENEQVEKMKIEETSLPKEIEQQTSDRLQEKEETVVVNETIREPEKPLVTNGESPVKEKIITKKSVKKIGKKRSPLELLLADYRTIGKGSYAETDDQNQEKDFIIREHETVNKQEETLGTEEKREEINEITPEKNKFPRRRLRSISRCFVEKTNSTIQSSNEENSTDDKEKKEETISVINDIKLEKSKIPQRRSRSLSRRYVENIDFSTDKSLYEENYVDEKEKEKKEDMIAVINETTPEKRKFPQRRSRSTTRRFSEKIIISIDKLSDGKNSTDDKEKEKKIEAISVINEITPEKSQLPRRRLRSLSPSFSEKNISAEFFLNEENSTHNKGYEKKEETSVESKISAEVQPEKKKRKAIQRKKIAESSVSSTIESETRKTDTIKFETVKWLNSLKKRKQAKMRTNWANGIIKQNRKKTKVDKSKLSLSLSTEVGQLSMTENFNENIEIETELPQILQSQILEDEEYALFKIDSKQDIYYFLDGRNSFDCKLCDYKGKFIVFHYRTIHPESENLISRLNPEVAEKAQIESKLNKFDEIEPFEEIVNANKRKTTFVCRFCNLLMTTEISAFVDHVCCHTGEYRYICELCPFIAGYKITLCNHYYKNHPEIEPPFKLTPVWPSPPNFRIMFGYLCKACNFTQILRKNIQKHINVSHLGQTIEIIKISMSSESVTLDDIITTKNIKIKIDEIEKNKEKIPKPNKEKGPDDISSREHLIEENLEDMHSGEINNVKENFNENIEIETELPQILQSQIIEDEENDLFKIDSKQDIYYFLDGRSSFDCKLCDYKGKFIVFHYRTIHPESENLISRLNPEVAEKAQFESKMNKFDAIEPFEEIVNDKKRKTTFVCRFCNLLMKTEISAFVDHVCCHTGEYRYKCELCPFIAGYKITLCNHYYKNHPKIEPPFKLTPIWSSPPNFRIMFGYLCKACNFTQILRKNIQKHINVSHLGQNIEIIKISMSSESATLDDIITTKNIETKIDEIEKNKVKIPEPNKEKGPDDISPREHLIEENLEDMRSEKINNVKEELVPQKDCSRKICSTIRLAESESNNKDNEDTSPKKSFEDETVELLNKAEKTNRKSLSTEVGHLSMTDNFNENIEFGTEIPQILQSQILQDEEYALFKIDSKQDIYYFLDGRNSFDCKLCDYKGKFIVFHYRTIHPESENLISRLNPEVAEKAQMESKMNKFDEIEPFEEIVNDKKRKTTFICRFCNLLMKTEISAFVDHVCCHTGEYRYICELCPFIAGYKINLCKHYHKNHPEIEPPFKLTPTWPSPPNFRIMFGYLCKACNFTQILRKNIQKHINVSHLGQNIEIIKISMSSESVTLDDIIATKNIEIKIDEIEKNKEKIPKPIKEKGPDDIFSREHLIEENLEDMRSGEINNVKEEFVPQNDFRRKICSTIRLTESESNNEDNEDTLPKKSFEDETMELLNKAEKMNRNDEEMDISNVEHTISTDSNQKEILDKIQELGANLSENNDCHLKFAHFEKTEIKDEEETLENTEKNINVGAIEVEIRNKKHNYICKVPNCNFTNLNKINFMQHCNDVHSEITVLCEICAKDNPYNYFTMISLFSHLFDVHSTISTNFKIANSIQAKTSEIDPSQAVENVDLNPEPSQPDMGFLQIKDIRTLSEEEEQNLQLNFQNTSSKLVQNLQIIQPNLINVKKNLTDLPATNESKCVPSANKKQLTAENVNSYKTKKIFNEMLVYPKILDIYKCPIDICSFSTGSQKEFKIHMASHTCQVTVCVYCKKSIKSENLIMHINTIHSHCSLQCALCFYRTVTKKYLVYHLKNIHKQSILAEGLFYHLNPENTTKFVFDIPPRNVIIFPYKCSQDNCAQQFLIADDFLAHLRTYHKKNFTCAICDDPTVYYKTAQYLVRHYVMHNIARYQCRYCICGTTDIDNMFVHYAKNHQHLEPMCYVRQKKIENGSSKTLDDIILINMDSKQFVEPKLNTEQLTTKQNITISSPTITSTIPEDHNYSTPFVKKSTTSTVATGKKNSENIYIHLDNYTENSKTIGVADLNDANSNFNERNATLKYKGIELKNAAENAVHPLSIGNIKKSNDSKKVKVVENELYKCGSPNCTYSTNILNDFRTHLFICNVLSNTYFCGHCDTKFNSVIDLCKHIEIHGKNNFTCGICGYKSSLEQVVKHMKDLHKIITTRFNPVSLKKDMHKEHFIVEAINETEKKSILKNMLLESPTSKEKNKVENNLCPEIIDRGLNLTLNYVMDLTNNEKMSDEKTTLVTSSHHKQIEGKIIEETNKESKDYNIYPEFVPASKRFICGALNCNYLTHSDQMLRQHLTALHVDETVYKCPYCQIDIHLKTFGIEIDKILCHLKMHESHLYKCPHCEFFHYKKRKIEKHIFENHPDTDKYIVTIRELDNSDKPTLPVGSLEQIATNDEIQNHTDKQTVYYKINEEQNITASSSSDITPLHVNIKNEETSDSDSEISSENMSNSPSNFDCTYCDFVAKTTKSLQKHERSHYMNYAYTCNCCNYAQFISQYMTKQMSTLEILLSESQLSLKRKRPSKEENIEENPTNILSKNKGTVTTSTTTETIDDDNNIQIYNIQIYYGCVLCSKRSNELDEIRLHFSESHKWKIADPFRYKKIITDESKVQHYKCNYCEWFADAKSLKQHCLKIHDKTWVALRKTKLKCTICSQILIHLHSMKNHFSKEHSTENLSFHTLLEDGAVLDKTEYLEEKQSPDEQEMKKFKCPNCRHFSNNYYAMKLHVIRHFNIKQFVCSYCNAYFMYPSMLKRHHIRKHADLPLIVDRVSDFNEQMKKISSTILNLNKDGTYSTKMKFVCSHCNCSFSFPQNLKMHQIRQHGHLLSVPECTEQINEDGIYSPKDKLKRPHSRTELDELPSKILVLDGKLDINPIERNVTMNSTANQLEPVEFSFYGTKPCNITDYKNVMSEIDIMGKVKRINVVAMSQILNLSPKIQLVDIKSQITY